MVEKRYRLFRIFLAICSLLYLAFLIYAVFFARRRHNLDKRVLNLIPIYNTIYQYRYIDGITPFNYYTNIFGNVLLFMPIPFILIYFFKFEKIQSVVFTGFAISFVIEFLQFVLDVGVADIDDLLLNTLGTLIGYYCYAILKKLSPAF